MHVNAQACWRVFMQACLRDLRSKASQRFQTKQAEASGSNLDQHSTASLPEWMNFDRGLALSFQSASGPGSTGAGASE